MTNLLLRARDVLTLLFAPRGRHRAGHAPPAAACRQEPKPAYRRTPGTYATDTPLDGAATSPVRPYVLTTEQRARRRTLWLATYGIGARHMHGMEVG
ncbi:hypothetical protein [Streptomyces sp. NPDC048581]|uniref:hypothetical protein n=1 Tax=unclassified Streptomyces TaxID=2593676 RepID=UPI00371FA143